MLKAVVEVVRIVFVGGRLAVGVAYCLDGYWFLLKAGVEIVRIVFVGGRLFVGEYDGLDVKVEGLRGRRGLGGAEEGAVQEE